GRGGDSAVAVLRNSAGRAAHRPPVLRQERSDAGCGDRTAARAVNTTAAMPDLRVSLVQGDTRWHDPAGNREHYAALLAPLAGATDLVVLPETFTSGFSNDAIGQAEDMHGATVAWIRQQA